MRGNSWRLGRMSAMEYTIISGDSHVDLTWLPGDLFASNAPADMAAKMPKVVVDEQGKIVEDERD